MIPTIKLNRLIRIRAQIKGIQEALKIHPDALTMGELREMLRKDHEQIEGEINDIIDQNDGVIGG